MKTRTDLLNFLIEKHGLKSYLEIGLQNAAQNFDKIKCDYKISVDPDPKANASFTMTSDKFFEAGLNPRLHNFLLDKKFDIVFIDGLHTSEQVRKDFENSLKVLSPNGFIVLHDCNPLKEEHTIVPRPTERGHWHGDVYKFAVKLGINRSFSTVDIDCGCGVFKYDESKPFGIWAYDVTWEDFYFDRKKYLRLISWDEFVNDN